MAPPFNVRSRVTPGVDLGEWDDAGNIRCVGYIDLADQSSAPAPPKTGTRVYSSGGQLTFVDSDGSVQLTAGAVGVTTAGTISGTTSAGAAPTVTITDCTDQRGNFLLNPVTGGGAQAAGNVATVRFAKAYSAAPGAVLLTMANETDSTAAIVIAPLAIATTGFNIYVGTALTTAKAYRICYRVFP